MSGVLAGNAFDRVEHALEERDCLPRGYIARDGMALCPAHADRNPSLHVTHTDGKILLYCFAGCEFPAVLNALALEPQDLYDDPADYWDSKRRYDWRGRARR